jgi:phosphatidylinositol 4-kinase A
MLILSFNFCPFHLQDQKDREKEPIPVMQLNLIRLLADLCVSVNKLEVVDMILPLFIENLEEGDALTPGLLRLRVCHLKF